MTNYNFVTFQPTINRLSSLLLATSHTYLYKKLDEFGQDFKAHIDQAVKKQGERMDRLQHEHGTSGDEVSQVATLDFCDGGCKITIDNFDYHQNVHHMTAEHQNVDKHYVTVMATKNRVTGNDLSDVKLSGSIADMDNGKCSPSRADHFHKRENYIALVERILVANIPYLHFLAGVVTYHIPHKYSMEMSTKSNTVCFEYLFLSKILGFSLSITFY